MLYRKAQTLLFVLLSFVCTPGAQAEIRAATPRDVSQVVAAVAANNTDFAEQDRKIRRETFPVLVIIPGIMGSELFDKSDGSVIWGELPSPFKRSRLDYPSSFEVGTRILESFRALVFSKSIYGDGLGKISDIQIDDPDFINVFSYDWRQDNRLSAEDFQEWLCKDLAKYQGRNLIILAHSMGGLIAKYWHKHYANPKKACSRTGETLAARSLAVHFIGTPHYGAPKSIGTFANGFSHSDFGGLLGAIDRNFFSDYVNLFGYKFPSAYQLLPIYGEGCFRRFAPAGVGIHLPPAMRRQRPDGGYYAPDNLFSAAFWRRMNWPRTEDDKFDAHSFYTTDLQKLLDSAHNFLCEVATYKLPAEVTTTYFVNQDVLTTPKGYELRNGSGWAGGKRLHVIRGPGDGTVPKEIASNFFGGISAANVRHSDAGFEHMNMLDADGLWRHVGDIYTFAQLEYLRKTAALDGATGLARRFAEAEAIPLYPLAEGMVPRDTQEFYVGFVTDIIGEADISLKAAYRNAREAEDINLRASVFKVVSESSAVSPVTASYAANNLVHIQFQNGYWREAAQSAEALRLSEPYAELSDADRRALEAKLLTTEGWARLEIGDYDEASARLEQAAQFGSRNALRGLDEIGAREALARQPEAGLM